MKPIRYLAYVGMVVFFGLMIWSWEKNYGRLFMFPLMFCAHMGKPFKNRPLKGRDLLTIGALILTLVALATLTSMGIINPPPRTDNFWRILALAIFPPLIVCGFILESRASRFPGTPSSAPADTNPR